MDTEWPTYYTPRISKHLTTPFLDRLFYLTEQIRVKRIWDEYPQIYLDIIWEGEKR